jgi:hypothetical protein
MALAFIDDSGQGGDSPHFVLGGYVAAEAEWSSFAAAWQAVLDLSPRLEYFKMYEAASLAGQFLGFSHHDRNQRLAKFIDVVVQHDLFEWSVSVADADYKELLLPTLPPELRSPYYFAFIGMVTALSARYRWSGSGETVDFVFDKQDGLERKALRLYGSFRRGVPSWRLGRVAYLNDKEFSPLQAADLIAWQTRRFMCSSEGTRVELHHLHSKYPNPPRSRIKRSDLVGMARAMQENVPNLVEEFGAESVEAELARVHRKNIKQGVPSPQFLSKSLK